MAGHRLVETNSAVAQELSKTPTSEQPQSSLLEGITHSLNAEKPAFSSTSSGDFDHRLTLLYELALTFGEELNLEKLLPLVVSRAVKTIPGARRGALLRIGQSGRES